MDEKIDKRLTKLEDNMNSIHSDLSIIKALLEQKKEAEILRNENIIKDVKSNAERIAKIETIVASIGDIKSNTERIKKLEDNQAKLVGFIVLAVVGAILKLVIVGG